MKQVLIEIFQLIWSFEPISDIVNTNNDSPGLEFNDRPM